MKSCLIAGSGSKDVKFIVMLAGTAVAGEQALYAQSEAIQRAQGLNEMMIAETIRTFAGEVEARRAANPWFRRFLELDPADYLRKVTCPVMALNGEKDTLVLARQNLPVFAKTLEAGLRDCQVAATEPPVPDREHRAPVRVRENRRDDSAGGAGNDFSLDFETYQQRQLNFPCPYPFLP
ncbi:MAG: hypothetical protein IT166_11160 [Bryobacterales bacterium]|nr:hypothetical protein [Bryobacterales bacterium]